MASARSSYLKRQSAQYAAYNRFGDRRVVTPNSLASSVANASRKALDAESADMEQKWKDGLISNEDLLNFLSKYKSSPLLTDKERSDADNTIRDLGVMVQTESLQAAYQQSPDGSPQRVQAAKQLSDFYSQYAGTLVPGTPAHSQALQKAGQWQQTTLAEVGQVQKQQRTLQRAQLLNEVANTPNNSAKEAMAKAQAYRQLAQSARADGAEVEALQYETQAMNLEQSAPQLATKESVTEIRKQLMDYENQLHDGKITADQFLQVLSQFASIADQLGDAGLNSTINRLTDTTYKNRDKYETLKLESGLPVRVKSGSGVVSSWDQEDYQYGQALREAQKAFVAGKFDSSMFANATEQYIQVMSSVLNERASMMAEREQTLAKIAEVNPNKRVLYNGKNIKVSDALDSLYQEVDDLNGQVQAANSGNFGVVEVPPDQFNASGDLKKSGKSTPTYRIVDLQNMRDKSKYAIDSEGVYRPVTRGKKEIDYATYTTGFSTNPAAYSMDKETGKYYQLDAPSVDVYEPGTSNRRTVPYDGTTPVSSYRSLVDQEFRNATPEFSNVSDKAKQSMVIDGQNQPNTDTLDQTIKFMAPGSGIKPNQTTPQQAQAPAQSPITWSQIISPVSSLMSPQPSVTPTVKIKMPTNTPNQGTNQLNQLSNLNQLISQPAKVAQAPVQQQQQNSDFLTSALSTIKGGLTSFGKRLGFLK